MFPTVKHRCRHVNSLYVYIYIYTHILMKNIIKYSVCARYWSKIFIHINPLNKYPHRHTDARGCGSI